MTRTALLALLLLASAAALPAAADAQLPEPERRPLELRGGETAATDTLAEGISPRGAFLRSLVLPGWGQSELGSPVRGGVYFALEAGSLWMLYKSDRRLREALRQQEVARATGEIAADARTPLVRDRLNQREDWLTLSLFWLFFSGADAFVEAHLSDFDLHVGASPRPDGGIELRARVPVGP